MPLRLFPWMACVLVAVMAATFVTPSFAWHMHLDHHEIADEATPAQGDEHEAAHHGAADDTQGDAHASIGHVLGHLTMHLLRFEVAIAAADRISPSAEVPPQRLAAESSPPYRPPLLRRLA